jgi:N-methylhydantoinase B
MATLIEPNKTPFKEIEVDPITLDLIENGLANTETQMNALLFRASISPLIREQRDGFPVLTDRFGRLHAGQFGSPVAGFMELYEGDVEEGDVLLTSDPYSCAGSISHANDWLVCVPVFKDGRVINWSAMFGHMSDIGGKVPGSMPTDATEIYEEGIVIPPVKIVKKGVLQKDLLDLILFNCRIPEWNRTDFNAILASCRLGEARCLEMAERFGDDLYVSALDQLLARNKRSIAKLIRENIPEEKQYFEDYLCDDGRGMGPYKMACYMWREGDRMVFDFSPTDPQSNGPINLMLSVQMFKMFCAQFMVNMFDPDILLNDGFFDLIDVEFPKGCMLNPVKPAALSGRTYALARIFDVLSGVFGKSNPDYLCAAGFSASPHIMFAGYDADDDWFLLFQIGFGGVPATPGGDGLDCHCLWPKFTNVPNEYLESYFPVRIELYESAPDTGGAGKYRGGNAMRMGYRFLAHGQISIHDDRWLTYPWGARGGEPGRRSKKIMHRADGTTELLAAKSDGIVVAPGDYLIFETWGGGGWGDPLERDLDAVHFDLEAGLLTDKGAREFGVVVEADGITINVNATTALRKEIASTRAPGELFNFGGTIEELKSRCEAETGFPPPAAPVFGHPGNEYTTLAEKAAE